MSLPAHAEITTRRLLHAQADVVYVLTFRGELVVERLSPISDTEAAEYIAEALVLSAQLHRRFDDPEAA